jgi:guanylate kinase
MSTDPLRTAVVLFGPPASGKDSVTLTLRDLDARYELYPRLKAGGGRHEGYRMTSEKHLSGLREAGELLYENERYGNVYGIDAPYLASMLKRAVVPVLHVGQSAAVRAVRLFPVRWVAVALWCARETTAVRALARGSADVAARLAAWDDTAADLARTEASLFTVHIDTDETTVEDAARRIDAVVRLSAEEEA